MCNIINFVSLTLNLSAMYYTYIYPSFIGDICIVADESVLLSISFCDDIVVEDYETLPDSAVVVSAVAQLNGYFAGRLKTFDLPLADVCHGFVRDVWGQLVKIPYGTMTTYGVIAERLGRKGAARAVGSACRKNPFAIIVPCHRVGSVSKGAMSGYAGGLDRKLMLLEFEKMNSGS